MINLSKGQNVNLSKEVANLSAIKVSCGWKAIGLGGPNMDLDVSIFLCGENGRVSSDSDFVFYNNKVGADGAVVHEGDLLNGGVETTLLDLKKIPAALSKAVFVVTIHEAKERHQNFGMTESAYISVTDVVSQSEIARYDICEDSPTATAMIFGEVYRHGEDWKFKAIGAGTPEGLRDLCLKYGVNVG